MTDEEKKQRQRESRRAWYQKNRESVNARKREQRKENAASIRLRDREYYRANKEAVSLRAREWRLKNREKIAERMRSYYAENKETFAANGREWRRQNKERSSVWQEQYRKDNKITLAERQKEYREKNKVRLAVGQREHYIANREKKIASVREWRKENPEKDRANYHRYRSRKNSAEGFWSGEDIRFLFEAQKGLCAGCDGDLAVLKYHVDHVLPLALGGSNWPNNLQLLCPSCNSSKGAKHPEDWVSPKKLKCD